MSPTKAGERRAWPRLSLRCPLKLYLQGSDLPIDSKTLNVSSKGFYCIVDLPFVSGESLNCILTMPSENVPFETATYGFGSLKLNCDVQVVRVDSLGFGYGVACQVRNFAVTRGQV